MILNQISTLPLPSLYVPDSLSGLLDLAYNLRWTWVPATQRIFQTLSPDLWAKKASPVQIILSVHDWQPFTSNPDFVKTVRDQAVALDQYLQTGDEAWYSHSGLSVGDGPVAYFCAEYAIHESMNQYAGGLGILAGDHCKEASDLALPFIGIGLFYRRGFFHQIIDWSGRQEALYPSLNPAENPLRRVAKPGSEEPLTISVELPGRKAYAAVWLMSVGRTPLVLLDTDLPENKPEDRKLTSQLYTNWREMRIYQELVLGVGGVRALEALGLKPSSYHLNEGHSAFLILERLRQLTASGVSLADAKKQVAKNSILTIHTPVPEGNERFSADLTRQLLDANLTGAAFKADDVLKLGLGADANPELFDLTAFALRHTVAANGVSILHGKTADKTWHKIAGKKVIAVTNGVHMPTWLGPEMQCLFTGAGASFETESRVIVKAEERPVWEPALSLDDKALWHAHLAQKAALIAFAQDRLFQTHARHGEGPSELAKYADCLDPDAFLIGFARRFATYKRAGLLFTDVKRITKLLNAKGRKVQVLFAGKSHPNDRSGQKVIEQVYALTQKKQFKGKVFLLEDYDMETGQKLVQGVDMWLNNPRRPLEASGTSGMKAAANGVPNTSILDGWWDEGYVSGKHKNGWAIGGREMPEDYKIQDKLDADNLYKVLEEEVLPAFFERNSDGIPEKWVQVMKQSIGTSLYNFSTSRMIRDYVRDMYSVAGK